MELGRRSLAMGKTVRDLTECMWSYSKKLQYPVKIERPNPAMAKVIISQFGGPHGELGAVTRVSFPAVFYALWRGRKGCLTDIGTEELGHMEMVSAIVYQLTRNLTPDEIKKSGFDVYFADHTTGLYPQAASGSAFSAETLASTGDVIADLTEDLAAEQKARLTYDNLLRLVGRPRCPGSPENSCGRGNWFIFSGSVNRSASPRTTWMRRTSTPLIRRLTCPRNSGSGCRKN